MTRQAEALVELERALGNFAGTRALTARELACHGKGFVAGWEIPGLIAQPLALRLLAPRQLPHAPVRVAVAPPPDVLSWPHLEDNGLLCLLPDGAIHRIESVADVALGLLQEAKALVEASLSGANGGDFEDEFLSYWGRWPRCTAEITSICCIGGDSRYVSAWFSTSGLYVGESDEELSVWLKHRFGDGQIRKLSLGRIPFLPLKHVPRPNQYPATVGALLGLLEPEAVSLLSDHLLDPRQEWKAVVCAVQTRRGAALFGFRLTMPTSNRRGGRALTAGFGKSVPNDILLTRFKGIALVGADVRRMDASWVHGRDANPSSSVLARKSVVVLGAGALGSGVAMLLAKAGVGALTILDSQAFGSENASRHELGVAADKVRKADALAHELSRRFPHLNVRGIYARAEVFCSADGEAFRAADLVIAAMADWASDTWLNAHAIENRSGCATLFAWMEPNASAGHSVVMWGADPCFRCLFDDMGQPRCPVTSWPAPTVRPVPACGADFQPYGAVELGFTQSVVAEQALDVLLGRTTAPNHRVWVGRQDLVEREGGTWNVQWSARHGEHAGGFVRELAFERAENCPEHQQR